MKGFLRKTIISLIICILLLVSCPMTINVSKAEGEERVEYENISDYISENGGYYQDYFTGEYSLSINDAVIKDFSDISNYTEIVNMYVYNVEIGNVNNVHIPINVEKINLQLVTFNGTLSLKENVNLEIVDIFFEEEEFLNSVVDIRGLEKLYLFDYSYAGEKKYLINEKILMDDYSILSEYDIYYNDKEFEHIERFEIYNNLTDYYEKSDRYNSILDIDSLYFIDGTILKDMSDIYKLENLDSIEFYNVRILNEGTYSFSNNKKLKKVYMSFEKQKLNNIVFDLRNLDGLKAFHLSNQDVNSGFELEKNLLMNDEHANILEYHIGQEGQIWCDFRIYENLEEYLEYWGYEKDEITDLDINTIGDVIKDLSGLGELYNLERLEIWNYDIKNNNIPINELTNLKTIIIHSCSLNEKLDLTNNTNLKYISIIPKGNLSNTSVDITGLKNIEFFEYTYYLQDASNFDLEKCIKTDLNLKHYSGTGYEDYYYDVEEKYYIALESKLKEKIIDGKLVLTGLELINNKITVKEFLDQKNFISGVEVKVFDSSDKEIVDAIKVLGTGTKVKLYENGELVQEYIVAIYGDTTGDGVINAVDALTLIKGINNKVPFKSEIHKEAGNIVAASGQTPTAVDALAIVKAANNKYTINQSK